MLSLLYLTKTKIYLVSQRRQPLSFTNWSLYWRICDCQLILPGMLYQMMISLITTLQLLLLIRKHHLLYRYRIVLIRLILAVRHLEHMIRCLILRCYPVLQPRLHYQLNGRLLGQYQISMQTYQVHQPTARHTTNKNSKNTASQHQIRIRILNLYLG